MNEIEISEHGNLLVFKKGYTPSFVFETIRRNNLKGLRIFAHLEDQRMSEVSFLRDYSFLEALDITSLDDFDFRFLENLDKLTTLSIVAEGINEIDLTHQTELKNLTIQWRKGKINGLENCQKLDRLSLIEFDEQDFSTVSGLRSLRNLVVKTAEVTTARGLDALKSLQELLLGNCRSLKSISAINGLSDLRSLEINTCTKIEDYDNLTDLPELEQLRIVNCKDIESIKFIENLKSLRIIALAGNTNVLDGDLTPTLAVGERFFAPKRHYNVAKDNMVS